MPPQSITTSRQWLSYFFFPAEDGIRDGHVTGVQTCALPISRFRAWRESSTGSARSKSPLMTVSDVSGATPAVSRGGAPEVSGAACELRHPGITAASNVAALERHRLMTVARVSRSAVLEIAPQFVAGPVDIRFYGAQGQVPRLGDFFVAEPFDMAEQDARPILGAQPRDGPLDRAAQLARFQFLERGLRAVAKLQGGGLHLLRRRGMG